MPSSFYTSQLPKHVHIHPFQTPTTTTNFTTVGDNPDRRQSGGAQNDFVEWEVPLQAGQYTVTLTYQSLTSGGIATCALNGTSVGTIDTYSASPASTVVGSLTGVAVSSTDNHLVRFTASNRNASSTGTALRIRGVSFLKTA